MAPQQTTKPEPDRPPPQEINDPGPGGGGGPTYNYMWVPLPEVKGNYWNGTITSEGQRLKTYATSHSFQFDYGTTLNKWCPVLVNQDAEADQLCLVFAIYYGCDSGATSAYYHDAWHAIRSMMRQWYEMPELSDWCDDGWIGMARNLLPYLIAADYLNSLGPIGTSGKFGFNNQQTFDSLKVFTQRVRDAGSEVKAPGTDAGCARSNHLRDMCWPQVNESGLGSPDNKGAAALASYLGATLFYKNREPAVSAWYDSAQQWYKAWYNHNQDHFHAHRFESDDNWEDSWMQEEGLSGHPQPILGASTEPRTWPYDCSGSPPSCLTWTSMSGALPDDLIRGGSPSQTFASVPKVSAPPLIYEIHISGMAAYMVNAAELLYQDGVSWTDTFGWASNGPKRTVEWHDYYAIVQDNSWPSGTEWPKVKDTADDWPCTFILRDRGFSTIESGTNTQEGKQMSFTDLTHRP